MQSLGDRRTALMEDMMCVGGRVQRDRAPRLDSESNGFQAGRKESIERACALESNEGEVVG